jgi:DNA-binding GntR family transcriptional regulator
MKTEIAPSLTANAYARLRDDILSGRLLPGTRLRLGDICNDLGVSLAVVREALTRLGGEGLVVTEPQRGFTVPPVSARDLTDLTEARIEIECQCLSRAIAEGGLDWEAGIVSAFHCLSRQPERAPDDSGRLDDGWAEAHAAFHASLISGGTNRWLLRMREMLFAQSERYRRLSVALQDDRRDLLGEHSGLMEATLARDTELACARMRDHLSLTTCILVESGVCDS